MTNTWHPQQTDPPLIEADNLHIVLYTSFHQQNPQYTFFKKTLISFAKLRVLHMLAIGDKAM